MGYACLRFTNNVIENDKNLYGSIKTRRRVLPGEQPTEIHNRFVDAVCNIFAGISSKKNFFTITETCTDGPESATIPSGADHIRFDILMINKNENGRRIHYCVECKTRSECGTATTNDLKRHLDIFLQKAYQSMDWLETKYVGSYGFLFISDVPFEVWDNHVNLEYVQRALRNETAPDNNKISKLHPKVKIMVFSDWFADLFKEV
jgi:hypothetical protein